MTQASKGEYRSMPVPDGLDGMRLDQALARLFGLSRTVAASVVEAGDASLDGTKVVNYAQWRSQDDFEAMLADERAQSHMREAAGLAQFEPNLYRVASVHHE